MCSAICNPQVSDFISISTSTKHERFNLHILAILTSLHNHPSSPTPQANSVSFTNTTNWDPEPHCISLSDEAAWVDWRPDPDQLKRWNDLALSSCIFAQRSIRLPPEIRESVAFAYDRNHPPPAGDPRLRDSWALPAVAARYEPVSITCLAPFSAR